MTSQNLRPDTIRVVVLAAGYAVSIDSAAQTVRVATDADEFDLPYDYLVCAAAEAINDAAAKPRSAVAGDGCTAIAVGPAPLPRRTCLV